MENINNITKLNMQDITMNNEGLTMNENQSEIDFSKVTTHLINAIKWSR